MNADVKPYNPQKNKPTTRHPIPKNPYLCQFHFFFFNS